MSDPALLASVTFYSAGIYPRFDQMGFEAAKRAADFCGEWANEYPLWVRHTTGFLAKKSEFPQREIPGFGERSSIYAMAVMAAFPEVTGLPPPDFWPFFTSVAVGAGSPFTTMT